jgi:predicted nucleic acid-binding protein
VILDASAAVDLVLDREPMASSVRGEKLRAARIGAQHLIDVDVLVGVRQVFPVEGVDARRGEAAVEDFVAIPIVRFPHRRLVQRAWSLREGVSAADAIYIALARALDARLVTTDAALARAPGLPVEVRTFA